MEKETTDLVSFFDNDADKTISENKEIKRNIDAQPLVTFTDDPGLTMPYLILISGNDEEGNEYKDWTVVCGRKEAYDYIKSQIEYIDLAESFIVSQLNTIKEKKPLIVYLKYVLESGKIEDPGFDPMDYMVGDYNFEGEDE